MWWINQKQTFLYCGMKLQISPERILSTLLAFTYISQITKWSPTHCCIRHNKVDLDSADTDLPTQYNYVSFDTLNIPPRLTETDFGSGTWRSQNSMYFGDWQNKKKLLLKCCCSGSPVSDFCAAHLYSKCVEVNVGQLKEFSYFFPECRDRLVPSDLSVLLRRKMSSSSVKKNLLLCVPSASVKFLSVCVCVAAFPKTTLQWRWDHGPGTSPQKSQRTPCQRSSVCPAGTVLLYVTVTVKKPRFIPAKDLPM